MVGVTASRNRLYVAFIPFMVVFLSYLGLGYYFSLATVFKAWSTPSLVLATLFLISLVYVFVRHTGLAIHRSRGESGLWRFRWVPWFLLLFLFSGYGFLAACLLLIEGPNVCREALTSATQGLASLQGIAEKYLTVAPKYAEIVARVRANQANLHNEIFSPAQGGFCGIGAEAKRILNLIHEDLPAVNLINGTDLNHSCADRRYLEGLRESYDDMIEKSLISHPLVNEYHIQAQILLKAEISDVATEDLAALRKASEKLAGVPHFIFNLDLYHPTTVILEKADADYAAMVPKLGAFVEVKNALPQSLDTAMAEQIASPFQVATTILSRWTRPTTWLYIVFAILADLSAAYIASTVFLRRDEVERQRKQRAETTNIGGSSVQYIWVPEPHPDTIKSGV